MDIAITWTYHVSHGLIQQNFPHFQPNDAKSSSPDINDIFLLPSVGGSYFQFTSSEYLRFIWIIIKRNSVLQARIGREIDWLRAAGWMLVTLDWDGCHWPVPTTATCPGSVWQFLFPALLTHICSVVPCCHCSCRRHQPGPVVTLSHGQSPYNGTRQQEIIPCAPSSRSEGRT